jgi:hypothetical protein
MFTIPDTATPEERKALVEFDLVSRSAGHETSDDCETCAEVLRVVLSK